MKKTLERIHKAIDRGDKKILLSRNEVNGLMDLMSREASMDGRVRPHPIMGDAVVFSDITIVITD